MDANQLIERMVAIESVSGSEGELARFLVGAMGELGFDARVDEVGNAVGVRRGRPAPDGSERVFVLLGHMDTVPGRIPVRVEDGVLHGRGSVDAKGPLATFVQAVAQCTPAPGAVLIVIGAVEEEVASSKGARHIARTLAAPETCLIGEPSGWDALTLGYKGALRMELELEQACGHGAGPIGPVAERAVAFWNAIEARAASFNVGRERLFDRLLPTLQEIRTASDGLHESVRARIGLRLPPDFDVDALQRELEAEAGEIALRFTGAEPAWTSPRTSPLARAFQRSLRRHDVAIAFKHKTGTSDMNVLGPVWGCPIAAYGPGDSTLDHTPTERLELAEYARAIDVLAGALVELGAAR